MNEKRLLPSNFIHTKDNSTNEIFISSEISISSDVNFLNSCIYDLDIPYLSASITSSNIVNTISNSATLISYTGLYNHVNSYLYLDGYEVKQNLNFDGLSSSQYRVISLPLYYHDNIEPGSFNMTLDSGEMQYSRYLRLKNDKYYDYAQNCSFVYLNDEDWLLNKCSNLKSEYSICITFKLDDNFKDEGLEKSIGYLFYRPRLLPRQDIAYNWELESICSTGIPFGGSYDIQYAYKFDKNYVDSNSIENGISIRIIYHSLTSVSPLAGKFEIHTTQNSTDIRFNAISSSATNNSQSGSFASLTSYKDLSDGNFHQLIVTKNISGTSSMSGMIAYLDGVRLPTFSSGVLYEESIFDAEYKFEDDIKKTSTPIFIGAKVSPINQQVINDTMGIITSYSDSNFSKYRSQNIEPEINPIINSIRFNPVINDEEFSPTGSNTNIYTNFGSVNNRLFLKDYYGILDDNLNVDLYYDDHDLNKLNLAKSVTNFGIMGFNGCISNFYLWDKKLEDIDVENGLTGKPMACINLSGTFSAHLVNMQNSNKYAATTKNLIGDYRFFEEDTNSHIIKNNIYDNSKHNYFKGCGALISHKDYKNHNSVPYAKIETNYQFYDINEKVYNNNLNHGKVICSNELNKKECGTIFYDLGIVVFDTSVNYSYNNITKNVLNSLTSNTSMTFNNSITSDIIVEDINYKLVKNNYNSYIDLLINSNEFNNSQNTTFEGENIYPTTFALYNDNDELLFIAKCNSKNQKNKYVDSQHKLKLNFK